MADWIDANEKVTHQTCRPSNARNPLDKEHWLKIAEDWMKMAQEAD